MKITKHEKITNDVRKKIQKGIYPPNHQLPSEKELCADYQVSRITMKKAIDILVLEGLLTKRRGSGTFVKKIDPQLSDRQFYGIFHKMDHSKIISKVITFEIIPAGKIADKLNLKQEDFVYHIVRYRYSVENPQWEVMEYIYIPINVVPNITKEVLMHSLYQYIEQDLGLKIQSSHRTLRAMLPNELEKKYMKLGQEPVLSTEHVGYLSDGTPFEYSYANHKGGSNYGVHSVVIRQE